MVGGLLLDGPDGAWFGAGALTWRLPPDGTAPTSVPVEADTVLARPATPPQTTAPPDRIPTFTYALDLTPPTTSPTAAATGEPPPSAAGSPGDATTSSEARATPSAVAPTLDVGAPSPASTRATWWPAPVGVLVAVLLIGTLLARRR